MHLQLYHMQFRPIVCSSATTSFSGWCRAAEGEVERIASRALGARATLVRLLPRPAAPVRPAKGAASAATDEVRPFHTLTHTCLDPGISRLTGRVAWDLLRGVIEYLERLS